MFAIFLSEKLDPFYQNITAFPTFIFTFFLLISVLFWLVAVLGFIDLDVLDFDLPESNGDIGADVGSQSTNPDVLAGLMLKFGLHGVPVTVIISFISLFGWLLSYYASHYLLGFIEPGFFRYVLGLPIFCAAFYGAVILTSWSIKPLRPLFLNARQQNRQFIIGQTATVRSSTLDRSVGEVVLNVDGASLLLRARSFSEKVFTKGDKVVLLEHDESLNIYKVISVEEFTGQ